MAKKEKTQKVELPRTYVTFLLDRSGSMSSIKSQTIEGFNTYLAGLQAEKDADIRFTFLTFDTHSLDKIYVGVPVKEAEFLTDKTFQPRAGTPLIDASYQTIMAVEDAVARDDKHPKVVVCIQTDGYENASHSHTWAELSMLVKAKQEAGWQFNFLGAGIDAYMQAAQMGLAAANTMSYGTSLHETRAAFGAMAQNTQSFASARSTGTQYSAAQKTAAGDKFVPPEQRSK